MSNDTKKPWRSEELNDIIGDNIYHDNLDTAKTSNVNPKKPYVKSITTKAGETGATNE